MSTQIGLALSGGGAKGIAHIGVLKVLEEAQIPVHMVAGTSMGGVVAAAYAAGRSASEIEQSFRSLRLLDIVQRDRTGLGLLGQDKMASRLREALGGDLTFDQLKLDLALVAVDLETGEEIVIREGSVVEAALATAALPIVFPPVRWRGRMLIDGGVLNPVPFDTVRQMGADRVIAVHTLHDLSSMPEAGTPSRGRGAEAVIRLLLYRSRWTPLLDVSERSLGIMSRKLVEQRMREAPPDLMIEVLLKDVGLFDLDQVDVCLRAGEKAARQHLSELIELRDTPLPSRWARWWQALRQQLPG
ncbi:MAG: patatin-like phospholipase family protein [Anaerolineae bacterium]|nr:patatin-like phospholipase family protein [Anaerolineae bacterium]